MYNKDTLIAGIKSVAENQQKEITIAEGSTNNGFMVKMLDHLGLNVIVTMSEDVIRVSSDVISQDKITDSDAFNASLLALHSSGQLPLSMFGIRSENGTNIYEMIGVLSANSKFEVIFQEIEVLAENVIESAREINHLIIEEKEEEIA